MPYYFIRLGIGISSVSRTTLGLNDSITSFLISRTISSEIIKSESSVYFPSESKWVSSSLKGISNGDSTTTLPNEARLGLLRIFI